MFVGEVALHNFRNFKELNISLSSGINLFYGNNGSGKTSFLEALQLYWNGKSFRTKSLNELICRGEESFVISGKVYQDSEHTQFGMDYDRRLKQRRVRYEGNQVKRSSLLAAMLPTLYFSPTTSYYSTSSPSERRDVLNWLLFHVEHEFASVYANYRKALSQRNALIRSAKSFQQSTTDRSKVIISEQLNSQFDYWDEKLFEANSELDSQFTRSVKIVNDELHKLNDRYNGDFRTPHFEVKKLNGSSIESTSCLKEKRQSDIVLGYTSSGFHRADISFINDGKKLTGLSRGEEKTVSLIFLIAILTLVKENKANILFLLDDIGSELDVSNTKILFNTLNSLSIQCFISAIDKNSITQHLDLLENYKLFHVKQGWITED